MGNPKIIAQKEALVNALSERMKSAQSLVFVDYRGLTVEEVTALRNNFRAAGVEYEVIKNTMLERAAEKAGIEGLTPYLKGPTAVAFGVKDAVAPAKIMNDFIAKAKKTQFKCGVVDNRVVDAKGVVTLASLPSREELIAKMLGSMNAPITGFVSVLGGTLRKFLYTLKAIEEQKAN